MTSRSRRFLQLLILLLVGACCLGAQSKSTADLAVGKVLVAPRDSSDPIFAKTVVLLVRYSAKNGALGLLVNHRSTVPISRLSPQLEGTAKDDAPLFIGGPVQLNIVFALARAARQPEGATQVAGDVYFLQSKTSVESALKEGSDPKSLRIYLGYCGWAPNQLETEVTEGRWFIFDGSQDLAFDAHPETLWSRLIRKTEEQFVRLGQGPRAARIPVRTSPASE